MPTDDFDTRTIAQQPAQQPEWQMDQDGPIDWALDVPIPYRLSDSTGVELDVVPSELGL